MTTLTQLSRPPHRDAVIADAIALIDAQVKRKGLIVRGAFATLKAVRSGIVRDSVDSLLDAWLAKLEPHHEAKTGTLVEHFAAHANAVANDLLSVTDERAAKSQRATVKRMYARLRDSAKANVVEALPELAALLEQHVVAADARAAS